MKSRKAARYGWMLIIGGAVVILLAAVGWFFVLPSDDEAAPEAANEGSSWLEEFDRARDRAETPPAEQLDESEVDEADETDADGSFGGQSGGGVLPSNPGNVPGGAVGGNLPGLGGTGLAAGASRHNLRITVTSAVPIGTVGYVIPTSLDKSSGTVKNAGRSWSLSTRVYGDPDYARVFVQAGFQGHPVTCVISVDGRVTERRATEGPYGQMMCQG